MQTTCFICHRPLRDPKSVERGMGDVCASHNAKDLDLELAQRDDFADEVDASVPFAQVFVMRRVSPKNSLEAQQVVTNIPHLVVHHSPNGYEFGYGGSGPADLALNACQLYLNMTGYEGTKIKCHDGKCWKLAWMLHQDFKDAFVSNAPRNCTSIAFDEIDEWMKDHITVRLLQQCAAEIESEE